MASSYFIPLSMRARATRTGALGADAGLGQASAPSHLPLTPTAQAPQWWARAAAQPPNLLCSPR